MLPLVLLFSYSVEQMQQEVGGKAARLQLEERH